MYTRDVPAGGHWTLSLHGPEGFQCFAIHRLRDVTMFHFSTVKSVLFIYFVFTLTLKIVQNTFYLHLSCVYDFYVLSHPFRRQYLQCSSSNCISFNVM